MTETRDPAPTAADLPLVSHEPVPSSPLVRAGGALGILASLIGLAVLVAACAGFGKALALSVVPVGLGGLGLLLALAGALFQKGRIGQDTHVLQALFTAFIGLVGGLLEMAVWREWPIFYK